MGWSVNSGWSASYQGISGSFTRSLLNYTNTGSTPQIVKTCYLGMATGYGTYTEGDRITGSGQPFTVYAAVTDSRGVTHTSDTLRVENRTSGGNYYNTERKTFTFGGVYVAAGATVTFTFYFTEVYPDYETVIILRYRGDSSTYGGSVSSAGLVRIYTGSGGDNGWHYAIPWVYTGSGGTNGWHQAMPWVYTGSGGTNGWHVST